MKEKGNPGRSEAESGEDVIEFDLFGAETAIDFFLFGSAERFG